MNLGMSSGGTYVSHSRPLKWLAKDSIIVNGPDHARIYFIKISDADEWQACDQYGNIPGTPHETFNSDQIYLPVVILRRGESD